MSEQPDAANDYRKLAGCCTPLAGEHTKAVAAALDEAGDYRLAG